MKFRKLFIGAATLGMAAIPLVSATAAPAKPAPKATGSVALGTGTPQDPYQYVTFNALGGSTTTKGNLSYTNFDYDATAPTGVWDVADWSAINFDGGNNWTLSGLTRTPTSTTSESFTATATYQNPAYVADVTGTVSGSTVQFTFTYTGERAGSTVTAVGTILSDGSMDGSSTVYDAPTNTSAPLDWTSPAGSADPALSFTAPITCVTFPTANSAIFAAVIPESSGAKPDDELIGKSLAVRVVDNGEPGTADTYQHALGNCTTTPTTGYTVTGGNIQVKP